MLQFLETNVIKKETEKILKYKDLMTEIQLMWNVKAKMISVITGATGTISKSLRQYFLLQGVKETGRKGVKWKDQVVGCCDHGDEPSGVTKFG